MKKYIVLATTILMLSVLLFVSCQVKDSSSLEKQSSVSKAIVEEPSVSEVDDAESAVQEEPIKAASQPPYNPSIIVSENNQNNTLDISDKLIALLDGEDMDFQYETIRTSLEYEQEIRYPQFVNILDNFQLTDYVNSEIQRMISLFEPSEVYRLDFIITKSNENILSIYFFGDLRHPRKHQFPLTFDLNNMKMFDITYYNQIDEVFADTLLKKENIAVVTDVLYETGVLEGALDFDMEDYHDDLVYYINYNKHPKESIFFGENKELFFLLEVSHVWGDYVLLSVPLV